MGLFRRRVDTEDHALSAVAFLGAVHPDGIRRRDLEHHHGRRVDGVVRVGHEARIDTALHLHAGVGKRRLRDGVVH